MVNIYILTIQAEGLSHLTHEKEKYFIFLYNQLLVSIQFIWNAFLVLTNIKFDNNFVFLGKNNLFIFNLCSDFITRRKEEHDDALSEND